MFARTETDYNSEDMIAMFEFPVRHTYELLGEQLDKVQGKTDVEVKVSLLLQIMLDTLRCIRTFRYL